jgi:hypothetical protein
LGEISLQEGLFRMEQLERYFNTCISKETILLKILFDVRNAIWENAQTHDALAKIARKKFDSEPKDVRRYVAVLNSQHNGPTFANEYWFTSKDDALTWLSTQGG